MACLSLATSHRLEQRLSYQDRHSLVASRTALREFLRETRPGIRRATSVDVLCLRVLQVENRVVQPAKKNNYNYFVKHAFEIKLKVGV